MTRFMDDLEAEYVSANNMSDSLSVSDADEPSNVVPLHGEGWSPQIRGQGEPHCLELETAWLGMALMYADQALPRVADYLRPGHFFEPVHQRIFEMMLSRQAAGKDVSPLAMAAAMREDPALSALFGADADPGEGRAAVAGVRGYFAYLAAAATIPLQCDSGAQMILEYAMRRQELLGYAELAAAVHVKDTPGESDKRRRQAAEHMELHQDVSVASRRSDWDAAELTADLMATLRAGEKPKAFYCGSHSLQAVLGGFDPGGLYILAGRPGMGKSACASSWSVRMAKAGHGVMRFDLEMTAQQQRNRMVTDWAYSGHRDVSYFDLGRNDVDPGRLYAIEDAAKFIGSLPMHFSDRAAPTLQTIRMKLQDRQARAAAKGHRIDIVVVDHLGLMRPMVKAERRDLDVGELTAGLKSLAKDMGVAVLALHQLSRPAKGSEAARPTLESLRDSGRVEEDADVVMLLYREHYFEVRKTQRDVEKMLELEHKLEVDVAKNRGGRTTKLEMFCDMATSRISDIAR